MKDLNISINDLIDESVKNQIKALKRQIQNKDYEIEELNKRIKFLKDQGTYLFLKYKQIINLVKKLEDECCFYITDEEEITFGKNEDPK